MKFYIPSRQVEVKKIRKGLPNWTQSAYCFYFAKEVRVGKSVDKIHYLKGYRNVI